MEEVAGWEEGGEVAEVEEEVEVMDSEVVGGGGWGRPGTVGGPRGRRL